MWQIPVFAAEREAGLADLIQASASCITYAVAKIVDPSTFPVAVQISQAAAKIRDLKAAKASIGDFDLHYLKAVLVTAGVWNKNDDVFDPLEVYAARATPEDKPVNYEHDCKDIIGHITANYVIDEQGKVLPDDLVVEKLPAKFHIVAAAVIYKYWADEKLQKRMDQTIAEIVDGKWCVSMESLFRGFDYAVKEGDGTEKVIARSDKTAFLTKHLRAYGGTGKYQDKKIGRILRNMTFSGKGLVKNPANPESIILDDAEVLAPTSAGVLPDISHISESKVYSLHSDTKVQAKEETQAMATELELQLQKQLAEKTAEIEKLQASLRDNDVKQVKAQVDALTADLKARDEQIKSLGEAKAKVDGDLKAKSDELVALTAKVDEVSKQHAAASEKLALIETEKKKVDRLAKVKAALKVDEAQEEAVKAAQALAESLFALADDQFDAAVTAMASTNMMTKPAPTNGPQSGNSTVPHGTPQEAPKATSAKTPPKATDKPAPMAGKMVTEAEGVTASENVNANTANLDTVEADKTQAAALNSVDSPEAGVSDLQKSIASFFGCEVEESK